MSRAWQGDWHDRIDKSLHSRGFNSVCAFAASMPCKSWIELASELDEGNVAAVQIRTIAYHEAEKQGDVLGFAKDCIVRDLHEWVPGGWGNDDKFRSDASAAYACWITSLGDSYREPAERAWDWLEAQEIPDGWLPEGPNDPWIEAMFRETSFPGAGARSKPNSAGGEPGEHT